MARCIASCTSCRRVRREMCKFIAALRQKQVINETSCARGDTICPRPAGPPPVHSLHALRLRRPARLAPWIFMIDRQRLALGGGVETGLVDINYVVIWTAKLSQPKRPVDVDLWPFDLESGVRVTCDVGYLCANFSLLRPVCSRVSPMYATDRQTSDKSIA